MTDDSNVLLGAARISSDANNISSRRIKTEATAVAVPVPLRNVDKENQRHINITKDLQISKLDKLPNVPVKTREHSITSL